jgi:DNA-binding LacI/PurR family transcriptional regulator
VAERRVTLQTIADAVGVSRTTVSNAYSRPDQLNPALRERILATAAELGYAGPDAAARSLRRGRAGAIGLLFTETLSYAFSDPYALGYLRGFAEATEEAGSGLLLIPIPPGSTGEDTVRQAVVDGFCVYCLHDRHAALKIIRARNLPVVTNIPIPELAASYVGIDERAAARRAADHLIGLGHRRIVVIVDWLGEDVPEGRTDQGTVDQAPVWDAHERVAAFYDAFADAELDPKSLQVIVAGRNTGDAGAEAAASVLDVVPRPTAIFAASDVLALGVLDAARRRGLRVPQDLSIAGFDDIPAAEAAGLTTVHQPGTEKGRQAGRLLLDLPDEPVRRILPTHLVVRATTGPAPDTKDPS